MTVRTILVVEDEGLIALHLIEMLENAGYLVGEPVHSGELAVSMLGSSPHPDLILMDVGLGGTMDGIETAHLIRHRYGIPLIFVTAYCSDSARERMMEAAPAGIITKPFETDELLECVGKAIRGKSG
jgi:two-component system, response regulator PdtaR